MTMMWTSSEAILVIIYLSHKHLLRACFEEGAAAPAEKQEHAQLLICLPNGDSNGSPLQDSRLEDPMVGGAW